MRFARGAASSSSSWARSPGCCSRRTRWPSRRSPSTRLRCASSYPWRSSASTASWQRRRADQRADPGVTSRPGDWNASAYDRVADPQARWGATVLERLTLDGDETVLDAGCGTGRVTELLLERLPRGHVVALDASPSMLAEARGRLTRFGAQVEFVHADLAQPLPRHEPHAALPP